MLNPIEEAKFAELKAMCRELKVPAPPEIMIGLKVHDKNGILTFDDIQRGHSWNRNFYNYLFALITACKSTGENDFGAGKMTGRRSDGVTNVYGTANVCAQTYFSTALSVHIVNLSTTNIPGIAIGTDDTAFSAEQSKLVVLIANGTGTGQMSHVPMAYVLPTYAAKTWKTTYSRIFNNNSGGSITVKETGLYSGNYTYLFDGNAGWNYLFERSVLAPTVAVANGAQLTVTYEISMDFSAID